MSQKSVRFMNNNYIERVFTYSSQQASFPARNVFNTSRSRVWKPAGNFEVSATTNKLYINDGANKTITLTVGFYTYASLAAHIQTMLNAASSNWLCVYNDTTTFKFTISRSSGTAMIRKSQTTNAAWDLIGYSGNSDISGGPFVADEQRNHSSEWVQCDLGVPQEATFAGIISEIDKSFTLSESAVVKLRANNIDYWNNPPVDIIIPVTDLGVFKFTDDINTASYRFWRIEFIDRLNYLGPNGISIAYIYCGDHITMAATNIAVGFTKELVDPTVTLQSEVGALFFEIKPRYLRISGNEIQLIEGTERKELEQLFYDLGMRQPFFISIDPGMAVTTELEDLTRFMVMERAPTFQHVLRGYYNIQFDMREAF